MDCIEGLKQLDDESIDLIITSPPYNVKNNVGGFFNQESDHLWKNCELKNGYENYSDDMPYDEYIKWQRDVLTECMRVLKKDGAIFYNHKFRIQEHKLMTRMEIIEGFPLRQIIIWNRKCAVNFNYSHIPPCYEVIFFIAKEDFRFNDKGGWTDVWEISPEQNNKHPAPFPLEIPIKIIEKTNAKIILDCFMGSGTTAIASMMLNRQFIGFEISNHYCEMANKRIKSYREQTKLNVFEVSLGTQ